MTSTATVQVQDEAGQASPATLAKIVKQKILDPVRHNYMTYLFLGNGSVQSPICSIT